MEIVLNENEWAAEKIESRVLGQKPFTTIRRVARYYIDEGYSRKDVRKMLDSFLEQCDQTASLAKWSHTLDKALSVALKHKAIDIEGVHIFKSELQVINTLKGMQLKRLAFTLLCLAKYNNAISDNSTDSWVNYSDSDIMKLANIKTSVERQSGMFRTLMQNGMIQFSRKVDNVSVRVTFVDSSGDSDVFIDDFRNLGYQYMFFCDKHKYYRCENCGVVSPKSNQKVFGSPGRPRKYCPECSYSIRTRTNVNSVSFVHGRIQKDDNTTDVATV